MSLKKENKQMSMYEPNLEELVSEDHKYRKLLKIVAFEELTSGLKLSYSETGRAGYAATTAFKCLLLQFMNDLSDREMEESLKYDLSYKLFCGFKLLDKTPDHSYFGSVRKRFGIHRLTELFKKFQLALKDKKLIREVFTFIDATDLRARVDHWKARDKAIVDAENEEKDDKGNPTMNNKNVSKYSSDKDAKFGAKGKNKIWMGYKKHVGVDMSFGFISKISVTPANVSDGAGLKEVCPDSGMVFADKAYCVDVAQEAIKENNCHSGAILKNNMKNKNKDKDRWISKVRMPFEGVFSKMPKKCRYFGLEKATFQATMEAFVFNFKRLITLEIETVPIS